MTARVGIDIHADSIIVARVSHDLGRPMIQGLHEISPAGLSGHDLLCDARPVFGVPDHEVLVKSLRLDLPESGDIQELLSFEMSVSLLEPAQEFLFSAQPTSDKQGFLGLIYRKSRLERLVETAGFGPIQGLQSQNFLARSAALGRAFVSICQPETGELIGLIDLTQPSASVCLLYKGRAISLGHLMTHEIDFADDQSVRQLAIQARTLINFQISDLASEGLRVPLATLILTGRHADERLCKLFAASFPSGAKMPVLSEAFFPAAVLPEARQSQYLVAIGLAVN